MSRDNRTPPSVRAILSNRQQIAAGHVMIVDGVSKQYGERGIKDVSFAVYPGEFVFLTGRSGGGKTTLLRLIQGKLSPESGQISIGGISLSSMDKTAYRRRVGFVSQTVDAIERMTVAENIAYPLETLRRSPQEIRHRVDELLSVFGLEHARDRLANNQSLSGGEYQRMGIARAIAHGPDLLLCDEPTGQLDEITTYEVLKTLNQVASIGTTVVCATHDPVIVNLMRKRVIVISDGRVASDMTGGYRLG